MLLVALGQGFVIKFKIKIYSSSRNLNDIVIFIDLAVSSCIFAKLEGVYF